jgi:3-oxoacyl-[acyl-carrier protein] reductase
MDLGIAGRRALVCAASKGLGRGCAQALAREGVKVTIVARTEAALAQTAREIGAESYVDPDILVTNAGGPPPGDFRQFDRDAWIKAVDANMLTPIELIKATVDKMAERKFGRIVNITSSAVKAPIDILGLSNGARSGLTGFVAGIARKLARDGITINNLLPGSFETDRMKTTMEGRAKAAGKDIATVKDAARVAIPAQRFGNIEEFGAVCAFICSVHASYLVGQNILLDGGSYPGTF